jgi:hypothetical protein
MLMTDKRQRIFISENVKIPVAQTFYWDTMYTINVPREKLPPRPLAVEAQQSRGC